MDYNMQELFKAKVRRVGTSLGVLIPGRVAKKAQLRTGEEVEIQLLRQKKLRLIEEAFGIAKGATPFKRQKEADRSEKW